MAVDDPLLNYYLRVVLREETAPLRDRLHRGLVERGLKTGNPDHVMTSADVTRRLERGSRLRDYPEDLVLQGLESLVRSGDVEIVGRSDRGDTLYKLSSTRFQLVDRALAEAEAQTEAFNASIVAAFQDEHGQVATEDAVALAESFQRFVSNVLTVIGEHCAEKFVQERRFDNLADYPAYRQELTRAIEGLPQQLQLSAHRIFANILRDPTPDQAAYLYSVGQVYYIIGLLHLDPELQALQQLRLNETIVFLDTNVLVASLIEEHDDHTTIDTLLRLSRRLGVQLKYTEQTEQELQHLIDAADDQYKQAPPFSDATASRFADVVDNPFVQGWLASFKEHRASWTQYRVRHLGWRERLDHSFDIARTGEFPRIQAGSDYEALEARFRMTRGQRAAAHDAEMILGVESLVATDEAADHPFGSRFWFLTLDRGVASAAYAEVERQGHPATMLAEEWVHYVSPFLTADVADVPVGEIYARLLASHFFVSLGSGLSLADLQPYTVPAIDRLTEGISPEDLCALVVEAHRQIASTAAASDDTEQLRLEAFTTLVERKVEDRAQDRSNEFAKRAEDQFDELQQEATRRSETIVEKDARIDQLERDLTDSRRYRRTSLKRLLEQLDAGTRHVEQWSRGHPRRVVLYLGLLFLFAVGWAFGWLGIYWRVAGGILILAAILALDPKVAWQNIGRIFGRRSQSPHR